MSEFAGTVIETINEQLNLGWTNNTATRTCLADYLETANTRSLGRWSKHRDLIDEIAAELRQQAGDEIAAAADMALEAGEAGIIEEAGEPEMVALDGAEVAEWANTIRDEYERQHKATLHADRLFVGKVPRQALVELRVHPDAPEGRFADLQRLIADATPDITLVSVSADVQTRKSGWLYRQYRLMRAA